MKVQHQWLEAVRAAITAASAQRALYDKDVTWARHWRQFCTLGIDGPRGVGTSTAIIMAAGAPLVICLGYLLRFQPVD